VAYVSIYISDRYQLSYRNQSSAHSPKYHAVDAHFHCYLPFHLLD
ncbi:unnamed protein product, partial [Rotaria sordida]